MEFILALKFLAILLSGQSSFYQSALLCILAPAFEPTDYCSLDNPGWIMSSHKLDRNNGD